MKILKFPLGQMQANCYLLIKDKDCLIIDPGDEAAYILEKLLYLKLKPLAILATHGHFDHLMAVGEIQMSNVETIHESSLPLYLHKSDFFLLKRLKETVRHFLGYNPVILDPTYIKYLQSGKMEIGSFEFEIINTPGHTQGSVCIYFKKENAIFTGDTLFKSGIGRYDFSYSSKIGLYESLDKLFRLPGETIVYSGHGEETTIRDEKRDMV